MLINNYDPIDYRIILPYYITVTCFKYKNKGNISNSCLAMKIKATLLILT